MFGGLMDIDCMNEVVLDVLVDVEVLVCEYMLLVWGIVACYCECGESYDDLV